MRRYGRTAEYSNGGPDGSVTALRSERRVAWLRIDDSRLGSLEFSGRRMGAASRGSAFFLQRGDGVS